MTYCVPSTTQDTRNTEMSKSGPKFQVGVQYRRVIEEGCIKLGLRNKEDLGEKIKGWHSRQMEQHRQRHRGPQV